MRRAYICDYCGKVVPSNLIRRHERECSFNPKNKTCFTCIYCVTDYKRNIKCVVKDRISVSIFYQDLITSNCDLHRVGYPRKV